MPSTGRLSTGRVAKLIGKDIRTVHRMIDRGELPAIKAHDGPRSPYLISRAAVEDILAKEARDVADRTAALAVGAA